MLKQISNIFLNSLYATLFFGVLFSALEFYKSRDFIEVFQNVFKGKYVKTYITAFVTALLVQIVLFPLVRLIF